MSRISRRDLLGMTTAAGLMPLPAFAAAAGTAPDSLKGMGMGITEFDINDKLFPSDIAVRDADIAALGQDYMDLMMSYKQLHYVMAWGLVDRYSWLQGLTPRKDGLPKRPTPYDDYYQPKLLRNAIADAFRAAPSRA